MAYEHYDQETLNAIIAKLEKKLKRQQTTVETTALELEHWRQYREKLQKAREKK